MSLADRLDSVRRSQQPAANDHGTATPDKARIVDPFAAVKASVHQALLDSLGPQLYDPHLDQNELETKVRHTLQEVIDSEETPLSLVGPNPDRPGGRRRDPRPRTAGAAASRQ